MCSCLKKKPESRGQKPAGKKSAPGRHSGFWLLGSGFFAFLTGCAPQQPAAGPTPPPMPIDGAMQRRDWEPVAAYYPNGDTVAGVNRFPLRPQGGSLGDPDYVNAAYDLGASALQTVALPFTYLVVPPFSRQVSIGENIPPTYTAMPVLTPPMRQTGYGAVPTGNEEQLRRLESSEPLPPRPPAGPRIRRSGPLGPGDSDFMSSPPTPEQSD